MKNKVALLIFSVLISLTSFAQKEKMTREEKDEKNAARQARINSRNDYAIFRKQIMALKQFEAEKQKIPALRKSSKMNVKVVAVIDSTDNDLDAASKTLLGYIRQDVGENSTNMYEITFDRTQKQITSVKHTQEAIDADKELMDADQDVPSGSKSPAKKDVRKKSADDDDDADDEKPVRGKQKDDD